MVDPLRGGRYEHTIPEQRRACSRGWCERRNAPLLRAARTHGAPGAHGKRTPTAGNNGALQVTEDTSHALQFAVFKVQFPCAGVANFRWARQRRLCSRPASSFSQGAVCYPMELEAIVPTSDSARNATRGVLKTLKQT